MASEIRISSNAVSILRLPMAVMVVIIHHGIVWRTSEASCNGLYDLITNMLGGGLCQVAVPAFFLISGYFFYSNLESWNWSIWCDKLRRRIKSLLIPYLCWNVIKTLISSLLETKSFSLSDNLNYISDLGLSTIFWNPIDFPLWFIRDLMICVLISPLLWYAIKRWKGWFVVVTLVLYIFALPPFAHDLSGVSIPLFSLGGWIRMCREDGLIMRVNLRLLVILWILFYAGRVFTTRVVGLEYLSTVLLRLMKLSSVLLAFWTAANINGEKVVGFLKRAGQCSFWLFAAHTVLLRDISFTLAWKLLPMDNTYTATLAYVLTILTTLCLCFGTYYCGRKVAPGVVKVLCGR